MVGRKRHAIVDTLGMVWAVVVTSAAIQDRDGAVLVLAELGDQVRRDRVIWADAAYRATVRWAKLL